MSTLLHEYVVRMEMHRREQEFASWHARGRSRPETRRSRRDTRRRSRRKGRPEDRLSLP